VKKRTPKTQVNVVVAPRVSPGGTSPSAGMVRGAPTPPPVAGGGSLSGAPSAAPVKVVNVPAPQGPLGPLPAKRGGAIRAGAGSGAGRLALSKAQKGRG
jgi:hypothetical protein